MILTAPLGTTDGSCRMDRDEVIYLYVIYAIGPNTGFRNSCTKIAVFSLMVSFAVTGHLLPS